VSLGTRDRAAAIEKRRDIVLGVEPIKKDGPSRYRGGGPTMRELFDRAEKTVWKEAKSQATIRSNTKILTGLIGDEPVEAMTYSRLERLIEELRAMGYAPATIKRKLDAVSKVLRMATKWTDDNGKPLLASKPSMPTIKVNNMKDRVLSPDVVFRSRGERNTASALDERLKEPALAVLPLIVLRPNRDVVTPEYLAWAINQPPAQRHFDVAARGTNIRMIPRSSLDDLELDVPDIETQRRIVAVDALAERERELSQLAAEMRRKMMSLILVERASGMRTRARKGKTPQ
jgi:hypothetical protein